MNRCNALNYGSFLPWMRISSWALTQKRIFLTSGFVHHCAMVVFDATFKHPLQRLMIFSRCLGDLARQLWLSQNDSVAGSSTGRQL